MEWAYILYGPPVHIYRYDMIDVRFGPGVHWKAAEIWEYGQSAGQNALPDLLTRPEVFAATLDGPMPTKGNMLFVFADEQGGGTFRQFYSTEAGEKLNPLTYDGPTNRSWNAPRETSCMVPVMPG